jgi:hypothetical protein
LSLRCVDKQSFVFCQYTEILWNTIVLHFLKLLSI